MTRSDEQWREVVDFDEISRIQSRRQKGTQHVVKRPLFDTFKSSGALVKANDNSSSRRIFLDRLEALKTTFKNMLKYIKIWSKYSQK